MDAIRPPHPVVQNLWAGSIASPEWLHRFVANLLARVLVVTVIGMSLVFRPVSMGVSVAVWTPILVPAPAVVWTCVFRSIAGPRVGFARRAMIRL